MTKQDMLALELHRIGALKFGDFTLKSGLKSPFYIDMRLLVSAPEVLQLAAETLVETIAPLNYDRIAAIPYAALPIGVALSLRLQKPLIYTRKEKKEYGTGAMIEGIFNPGEHILLVDDLITRGDSKIEAIRPLHDAGLIITDIAVLLDRQSGGTEILAAQGYRLHTVLRMYELIDTLQKEGRIDEMQKQIVLTWLSENRV